MIRKLLMTAVMLATIAGAARANNTSKVWINEILYNPVGVDSAFQVIELTSLNSVAVNMSNWTICIHFIYTRFPMGATIQPGGRYLIHLGATGSNTATDWFTGPNEVLENVHDSLSLYHTFSSFTTPANMEDFLQWGGAGEERENIANLANLWTAGTFVATAAEGQSVQFLPAANPPTLKHPISDYCNAAPTLNAVNVCTPPMGALTDLIISEVLHDPVGSEAGNTAVELLNTSSLSVNLTGLSLDAGLNTFTFPAGNSVPGNGLVVIHLNLPHPAPGGGLDPRAVSPGPSTQASVDLYAFPFVDLDPTGDGFSIYKNSLDFTNAANMIDFVEWGAAGEGRESVAATKGIWPAGEFIGNVLEGTSIQWRGSGSGNAPVDFCADQPTLGIANLCSTSGLPGDHHHMLALESSRPNPFSASTTIQFTSAMTGIHARLSVFDLTGRSIRSLFDGPVRLGPTNVEWDGRDDSGTLVPGGLYFYRLETPEESLTGKTMVVR